MHRIIVLLSLMVLMIGLAASPSGAQVTPPPPHDHFLTVPGTGSVVQVGPPRCTLGETLQRAFLNFHDNVHTGTPATTGQVAIAPTFCP
jgi:hypothetical protein